MTEEQIAALAREYAEFTDMSEVDKKNISAICKYFLKYLLRRFCLVEKRRIKSEHYDAVRYIKGYHKLYGDRYPIGDSSLGRADANKELLDRLFPDLGKEVGE
ncbi:MAG: hypothetical protein J6C59_09575 [Muribaculaceae bacterium]|nr:hypothetical protein [Muribaculaceae bacterium]